MHFTGTEFTTGNFAAHPERYDVDPEDCEKAYPLKTAGTDPNS
jgi:hypothetical protein